MRKRQSFVRGKMMICNGSWREDCISENTPSVTKTSTSSKLDPFNGK